MTSEPDRWARVATALEGALAALEAAGWPEAFYAPRSETRAAQVVRMRGYRRGDVPRESNTSNTSNREGETHGRAAEPSSDTPGTA